MQQSQYECHITIEPVLDEAMLTSVRYLASEHGFRVAELLMVKRPEDTPERSKFDTFMTGRGSDFRELQDRAKALGVALRKAGFRVWRTKIEAILFDTDYGDTF